MKRRGRPPHLTRENLPERYSRVKVQFAMPQGYVSQVYEFPAQKSAWLSDSSQYVWRVESGVHR